MDRDLSNYRPTKLWRRLPLDRRTDAADLFWNDEHSADQQMEAVAARALVNYHLERQRPMMAAFLDLLGITHDNGLISEENVPKQDPAKLKQAAADLAAKYPAEDVSLYLDTLVSQDPETWEGLVDVTR